MLSRLKRLETHSRLRRNCDYRIGLLRKLPDEYVGERYIAVVETEGASSSDRRWCEFEERPGPAPPGSDDGIPRIYMSEDEMNF